jgi:hypothetical protein
MSFERYMAQVIEVLQTSLETAREIRAVVGAPFEAPVFRAPQTSMEELNAGLSLAALAMEGIEDPLQAARLAMLCGAFVEEGADAQLVSRAICRLASRSLTQMVELIDALDPDGDAPFDVMAQLERWPDAVKAWVSMGELVVLPLMTVLTRDAQARQEARQDAALVRGAERFEDIIENMFYLHALLECVEGKRVVVLEPETGRGWRLEVSGVRTCFHMFTLMKGVIPWPGTPDAELLAYARGELLEGGTDFDDTPWDLLDANSWTTDGWADDLSDKLVWGEQRPDQLFEYMGEAVVLIRPVQTKRSWSAGFYTPLHEAHRSEVRLIEALAPDEVTRWLAQCDALSRAT